MIEIFTLIASQLLIRPRQGLLNGATTKKTCGKKACGLSYAYNLRVTPFLQSTHFFLHAFLELAF